jgi:hypothetical protein
MIKFSEEGMLKAKIGQTLTYSKGLTPYIHAYLYACIDIYIYMYISLYIYRKRERDQKPQKREE